MAARPLDLQKMVKNKFSGLQHAAGVSNIFGTDLPAPKKEKRDKPKSDVVKKLIEGKEKERREKDEYERRKKKEKEKRRLEEEKKKRFVIPKKVSDDSANASPASDQSSAENSLFNGANRDSSPAVETKSSHKKDYTSIKEKGSTSDNKHKHSSDFREGKSDRDDSSRSTANRDHSDSSKHKTSKDDHRSHHSSSKSGDKSSRKDGKHHTSSDKHVSSGSKKDSSSHSSSSEKHKSEKSEHSHKHGSSSRHSSEKSSSEKSKHKSSSHKAESSKSSHSSSSSNNPSKVSPKQLSLEELRAQVKQMKQDLEPVDNKPSSVPDSQIKSGVNPNMFQPYKNRQGVEADEAEKRKAQILTKTQLILQRTKEKLAQEQAAKQPKKRLGKTSTGARKEKDMSGQIKSKSLCKDDSDSDDDPTSTINFETSFNEEYLTNEPGSILKTIKNKIDEKLSSYNFPDKPAKEKPERKRAERILKERREKIIKEKIKKDKFREKRESSEGNHKQKFSSFQTSDDRKQNAIKKPKIVRRYQNQPPPMNFQELLKIAEQKSKEKVVEPEPIFKPPKKKEERPMTKEERDRFERQKESRKRVKEEVMEFKKRKHDGDNADYDQPNETRQNSKVQDGQKSSQKDGSKLKSALTGNHTVPILEKFSSKSGIISSKPSAFSKHNAEKEKLKSSKYDSGSESDNSHRPSTSSKPKPVNPYQGESSNPWDRIYGQIQKKNPKAEKRKRQVVESSEEEDSDQYDEDDDFIDDDDAGEDYSSHIKQIFGYDKSKYKYEDEDDVDDMEANFTTIMKEEARSARLGLQEDLEDMRKEEEELRQKKLAKMKKMKYR